MTKRIVIIGAVAAGASAAAKARRTSEGVEIVLVEAGPYMSFANCGLPYFLGGEITDRDDLLVADPDQFAKRFNVDVRLNTTAVAIDRAGCKVTLRANGKPDERLAYDKLVLATGTTGIRPPIPGLDRTDVFQVRTIPDVDAITDFLSKRRSGTGPGESLDAGTLSAVVVGGGYIGLETAEQLMRRGVKVTLVELADQLMLAMDREMAWPVQQALVAGEADVILGDALASMRDRDGRGLAITRSGRELPFDLAILAVGVKPNVALARSAGLELGKTGAIRVDALQRTSDPDIYAAGDDAETMHLVLNRAVNIPLAGPANKAGRAAGANAALDLAGAADDDPQRLRLKGVLGTAIVRVRDVVAGVTGLTASAARRENIPHAVLYMPGASHAGYYPDAEDMTLKLVCDPATGRLLGAQAVGGAGVDKRIDVLATAIFAGLSVEDLQQLDLAYAPPFGSAKDVEILAGFAGANVRTGVMPAISPTALLDELKGANPPLVVDVRSPGEYAKGHLKNAVNVPVDQMRQRHDDVPADRPVIVHCGVGYRSYVAQRILMNNGRANVRNLMGGYRLLKQTMAAFGEK